MSKNSILDSSDSDEDCQEVVKSKKSKSGLASSENETDGEHDINMTAATPSEAGGPGTTRRSSERLRKKSQRRYRMPDRKQTLNKIVAKKGSYKNWSLKPRRLTNDFVRGMSHYVTDKVDVFESDDSELSDFIDDSYVSTPKKARQTKYKQQRKGGKCSLETDEDIKDKGMAKKRRQANELISSDEELQPEELDEGSTPGKQTKLEQDDSSSSGEDSDVVKRNHRSNKHHKNFGLFGDKSSSSENDGINLKKNKSYSGPGTKKTEDFSDSDEISGPTCKLQKRTKSKKKIKEKYLLEKLVTKRKIGKRKMEIEKTSGDTAQVKSTGDVHKEMKLIEDSHKSLESESEETQDDDLTHIELGGESDQEFVVDDDYCETDSDGVAEFFEHLHNKDNTAANDNFKMKEKKSNSFQRICIAPGSDESDDEAGVILDSKTLNIFNAITQNNVEYIRSLLESNSTIVDDLGPKRRSLLHYAVMSGSSEIAKMLIDSNAVLFAVDLYGLQPIDYAILTGQINCLKLLLQYSDLNEINKRYKDKFKFNLLHFIVYWYGKSCLPDSLKCKVVGNSGLVQCIETLFEQDKNLLSELMEEKDSQGFNPLVAAVIAGNCQCVEHLLHLGASVDDCQSKNGGNLLHLAVECLMEAEADRSSCLKLLVCTELKQKINEVDNSGFTPLMYAAQSGNHDCVLALLEAGASVSCKDFHGTTSLHLAAASGDTQCVELLLKYGHQVDCLDSCGWPPLLYANFAAQESCVLSLMKPNPKQIFVLGNLLKRGTSQSAKERNFKVVKDVLVALANQDAYYRVFNDFIRRNPEFLDEHDRGLLHKTWKSLLDFDNKLRWFKRKLANLRSLHGFVNLEVNREDVFESARNILKGYSGKRLRDCVLNVTFKNEAGICTGPKREFFVNICRDIVDSSHKLFHLTDDNQYSFIPNAYFADMAKTEGGTMKDQNMTSSKMETDQLSGMGNDGLSSTTMDVDGPSNACSDLSVSQSSGSHGTLVDISGSSSAVSDISQSTDEDSTEGTSTLVGTSVLLSSEEYMDDRGDKIVAKINITMEYAKYVDQQLAKNIAQLKFLGRIIGLAICQGHFLNLHLCKPLVKQILGIKLNHPDDLSSFDHALHKNLVMFVLESDDVEDLMLPPDLEVVNPWSGRPTAVKLFPEGRNEEFVNEKNKAEYVELVSQHKLTNLIMTEINALTQGLHEVVPKSLFSLFTADEFSLLINGVGRIDVDDWRKNTLYKPEDAADKHKEIKWFWEIVKELKEEEKALLLKFSTGSPCLPAGGFSQLQGLGGQTMFQITMKSDLNKIPTASTCFNNLKLSSYENIKDLKEKLLIAIRHGTEGFSFS